MRGAIRLNTLQLPDPFLGSSNPLQSRDAVAALLVLEDGRYIMQLRDRKPDIFYPGHWGCFGGAVDEGENPLKALKRELSEELELTIESAVEFTRFEFDFSRLGQRKVYRLYFEIHVKRVVFDRLVLHEGEAFEAIPGPELVADRRVTPYDAFAIWLHMSRRRFRVLR